MILTVHEKLETGEYLATNGQKWLKFNSNDQELFEGVETVDLDEKTNKLALIGFPGIELSFICIFDDKDMAASCFK